MKKLRVLHLTHPDLVPPDSLDGHSEAEVNVFKTDFDVVSTLRGLGHEVQSLGVEDELRPIRSAIRAFKPDVVFNLLEEFAGLPELDQHVAAYLELLRVPYTGCNPRGLVLARGKALAKKLMAYHRIKTPAFATFRIGRKVRVPKHLPFPCIVKSLIEESSMGISQASICDTEEKLVERVSFVHEKIGTDALAEEYIAGRELYQGVLGNDRLTTLPVWEMMFENLPPGAEPIATEKVKHDLEYQKRRGITHGPAEGLSEGLDARISRTSKRIYRILGLDGYGRVDYRLRDDGQLFFLEANPNPEIAQCEELASSAEEAGIPYPKLLQRLVNLGLQRGTGKSGT